MRCPGSDFLFISLTTACQAALGLKRSFCAGTATVVLAHKWHIFKAPDPLFFMVLLLTHTTPTAINLQVCPTDMHWQHTAWLQCNVQCNSHLPFISATHAVHSDRLCMPAQQILIAKIVAGLPVCAPSFCSTWDLYFAPDFVLSWTAGAHLCCRSSIMRLDEVDVCSCAADCGDHPSK